MDQTLYTNIATGLVEQARASPNTWQEAGGIGAKIFFRPEGNGGRFQVDDGMGNTSPYSSQERAISALGDAIKDTCAHKVETGDWTQQQRDSALQKTLEGLRQKA